MSPLSPLSNGSDAEDDQLKVAVRAVRSAQRPPPGFQAVLNRSRQPLLAPWIAPAGGLATAFASLLVWASLTQPPEPTSVAEPPTLIVALDYRSDALIVAPPAPDYVTLSDLLLAHNQTAHGFRSDRLLGGTRFQNASAHSDVLLSTDR
ncbi:MAG: hypothetical protein ACFB2Z_13075 [Maricaulaceae bacterium]